MSKSASTNHEPLPAIALTPGEPAGIGPDIALRLAREAIPARLVIVADPAMLEARARLLGERIDIVLANGNVPPPHRPGTLCVLPISGAADAVPGVLDVRHAEYVVKCLAAAADGALQGRFDAICTGPVHKGVINDAGIPFTGHTEYFAARCGDARPVMMLLAKDLRVALVTTHLPLRAVPDAISTTLVSYTIETVARALRDWFGIAVPRIAVCGLNPHAGEGGHLGLEDDAVIAPAIAAARAQGLHVAGPLPADTAFTPHALSQVDAVVTQYHDQGLPVLKAVGFGHAVNLTLGLSIIRTSVDHGTALDLAGSGTADSGSLGAAMALAIALARARHRAI
jgi:4-hydroxythreonine-4-phosphate dehydrogenase